MSDQEDRLDRLSRAWAKNRTDMDITPWQVWGRITRINDIFLARLSKLLNQHGLNYTELQTLGALIVGGPPYEAKPNAISRHNLLTSGGMTNVLTRMEKKGLISRRKDDNDRRSVIVSVTQQGLDAFEAVIVKENQIEHRLLDGIGKEDRETVATVLRQILLNIDDED
ncbi:MAG: MarR family transcriptional regulator [Kordiimonadaceae bacterium]|nr:MarR family transcriptional regulator [Kordiimonadaceae bacterium]MBO6567452.1 MarR family transcriptional regulator [Kordiimonadaceae bacterium]MBO6963334.1 MarR family transcriptional regulator [Kordiimonadaceae bacterium]